MIELNRGGKFTRRGFLASAAILAGVPLMLFARRAFASTPHADTPPDVLIAQFSDPAPDGRASGSRSPRKMSAAETGRSQALRFVKSA